MLDLLLCLLFQHDLTPIEIAAMDGNLAVVTALFDVTACVPNIPIWSCQGILEYINSQEAKNQVIFLISKPKTKNYLC